MLFRFRDEYYQVLSIFTSHFFRLNLTSPHCVSRFSALHSFAPSPSSCCTHPTPPPPLLVLFDISIHHLLSVSPAPNLSFYLTSNPMLYLVWHFVWKKKRLNKTERKITKEGIPARLFSAFVERLSPYYLFLLFATFVYQERYCDQWTKDIGRDWRK